MYRENLLHRNVLIVTDEVIAKAAIEQNVAVRMMQSAIEIAEERFIAPLLGDEFYEEFIDKKNVVVDDTNRAELQAKVNEGNSGELIVLTNGQIINAIELLDAGVDEWYLKLWNRFLWKITAECVAYIAMPANAIRTTAQGEMQNNPASPMGGQASASVDVKTIKFKMDKILQDRIDPLIEAMKKWMCTNKSYFPKWDSVKAGCKSTTGISVKRKGPWIHGVYDDVDKPDCPCNNDGGAGIYGEGGDVFVTEN